MKRMVLGIMLTTLLVCMLMLAFNFTVAESEDTESVGSNGTNDVSVTEVVDWWPMYRHDLNHTGYSTSKAPNTSAVCWSYRTGDYLRSSPAVVDGRVYIGSYDYNVYCLNASTGTKIWNYTTGQQVKMSSPAVVDGKVYVGSMDDNVYCLNASTGTKIWNYTIGDGWSPAVAHGRVYIGSRDGNLYCLNASTGDRIWSYTTGDWVRSSPAVAYGRVYVGSYDDNVYCLNASTGTKIWSYTTGFWVVSSPAVADGRVYVGSNDDNLYCLNASTGTKIWNYTTGDWVWSSPAVADGKVYVGSEDHRVYCFGERHDVAVTNVAPYKTVMGQGYPTNINVTVQNQGNMPETFNVTVYYNSNVINYTTVAGMTRGEWRTLTFLWNITGVAKGNHTIKAVADQVPGEIITSDNTLTNGTITVVHPGDLDNSGEVDIADVVLVTAVYRSECGQPEFRPNSDVIEDCVIDISDVVAVTAHYREKDP